MLRYNQLMAKKQNKQIALMLGSLGVVFGDIGTSPLYALKVVFGLSNNSVTDQKTVIGLISILLWTITLIVTLKYLLFVMRANNKGEGGIMALVTIIKESKVRNKAFFIGLGLLGVSLFYGDSVVTPAISVLSAVEGLRVVAPGTAQYIVPITLLILALLFSIQKFGTGFIGKLFGPIMFVWFVVIGAAGAWRITQNTDVLGALSPLAAAAYIADHPYAAFIAMGAVVLAVTGAEALYADMGHFGRQPIAKTWLLLVFPALALCYMGQGALLLNDPSAVHNPFFLLFPTATQFTVLILAALATLIASQAVISGAFSLTKQAIQLNFLPRMIIKQTSTKSAGQIYLPFVNFLLFIGVAGLVILFGSSEKLAGAYGVAVSGTLAIDSILFMAVVKGVQRRSINYLIGYSIVFLSLDLVLVAANIHKISHGGWLPLIFAVLVMILVISWIRGQRIASSQRRNVEEPLKPYISQIQNRKDIVRLPGQAVYIGHHIGYTPSALHTAVEELHELHEKVVIVYVQTSSDAHVPLDERIAFDELGYADGISQIVITYGFHDTVNIPRTLAAIKHTSPELNFDPYQAMYFISLTRVVMSNRHAMPRWQKGIFMLMSRNALSASDYYHLPVNNTIEMRTLLKV